MSNKVFVCSTRYSCLQRENVNDLFSNAQCAGEKTKKIPKQPEIRSVLGFMKDNNADIYKRDFATKYKATSKFIADSTVNGVWDKFQSGSYDFAEDAQKILYDLGKENYMNQTPDNYDEFPCCQLLNREVYAVKPHDGGDVEWIKKLCETFGNNKEQIFLLLHDKDLNIFSSGAPFYVLDKNNEKDKPYFTQDNLQILVFNHESNDVTDILGSTSIDNIEQDIENIFIENDKKKKYLQNIDNQFKEGENIDNIETVVKSIKEKQYADD